jgi:hypothetical protein
MDCDVKSKVCESEQPLPPQLVGSPTGSRLHTNNPNSMVISRWDPATHLFHLEDRVT